MSRSRISHESFVPDRGVGGSQFNVRCSICVNSMNVFGSLTVEPGRISVRSSWQPRLIGKTGLEQRLPDVMIVDTSIWPFMRRRSLVVSDGVRVGLVAPLSRVDLEMERQLVECGFRIHRVVLPWWLPRLQSIVSAYAVHRRWMLPLSEQEARRS